jgi:hypothetical protein
MMMLAVAMDDPPLPPQSTISTVSGRRNWQILRVGSGQVALAGERYSQTTLTRGS